ncbi:MAG: S8 family serine peptidase [Candidatus Sericytochromatia bacterium]|nr:S8 family serine peptidase [Candidatus Sericytochromatia bacterium]
MRHIPLVFVALLSTGCLALQPLTPRLASAPGGALGPAGLPAGGGTGSRLAVRVKAGRGTAVLMRRAAGSPRVVGRIPALGVYVLEAPTGRQAAALAMSLGQEEDVVWAHPTVAIAAERVPDDPLVGKQAHLPRIHAFEAWSVTRGEGAPPLAILDTGVDHSHPEFAGRLHPASHNVLTPGALPEDDYGHGNHVAGIAAASADNGVGVAGVAPRASLMVVKIMDANGRGDDATFAAGLVHAVEHGAKVVSMSFGAGQRSPLFEDALHYALERDVVLVASAGNENARNDPLKRPHLPSTFPGVIEVAATTNDDRKARFSNYGDTVALAAPGVDIFATYRLKFGGYGVFSGTSMATPMVAAVATLVRGLHPEWTRQQVRDHLERTADDLGAPGRDPRFGAGRLNAARAVGVQR